MNGEDLRLLLWEALGSPMHFVLLDYTSGTLRGSVLYVRPWATVGLHEEDLKGSGTPSNGPELLAWLGHTEVGKLPKTAPLALLDAESDASSSLPWIELALEAFADNGWNLEHFTKCQGYLRQTGRTGYLSPEHLATRPNVIAWHGILAADGDPLEFSSVPFQFRAAVSSTGAAPALFRVSADGICSTDQWFRISGTAGTREVTLCLTVSPHVTDPSKDTWVVTRVDDTAISVMRHPPPPDTQGKLGHLIVIFDRTCPDASAWVQAYHLSVEKSGKRMASENSEFGVETSLPPSEYNREIRCALSAALLELVQVEKLTGYIFADRPGDGVLPVSREAEALAEDFLRVFDSEARGAASANFDSATYVPGLDLWDPMEEALAAAVAENGISSRLPRAILIVGNSPPTFCPEDYEMNRIIGIGVGVQHFSTRRNSEKWAFALEQAGLAGIPVCMLFLTHESAAEAAKTANCLALQQRFVHLHNHVRQALNARLHIFSRPANADGVARGVFEAATWLQKRLASPSSLRLLRQLS